MTSLKLVSLNIERSKHLERVLSFVKRERPEVLCLFELMDYDVARFEHALGILCHYTPVTIHPAEGRPGAAGQGIFSTLPVTHFTERYYWGGPGMPAAFDFTNATTKHETETHLVSVCDIRKDAVLFRIAGTHFTWTPDGNPDDFQRSDLQRMFEILHELGEFALVGDFNAPRGGEIWEAIASRYKDNIPAQYTTSLDPSLHRKANLELMVDGLFTTPHYRASNVRLVDGVSDHMAVVADIERLP